MHVAPSFTSFRELSDAMVISLIFIWPVLGSQSLFWMTISHYSHARQMDILQAMVVQEEPGQKQEA